MKRLFILSVLLTVLLPLSQVNARSSYSKKAALAFIENKGQVTDQYHHPRHDIHYKVAATSELNIFIGAGTLSYQFSQPVQQAGADSVSSTFDMCRMDVALVGANKYAEVMAHSSSGYYENYYKHGQRITARSYDKITYKSIYPGIDWVLHISNGVLKHEFIVHPGGNVADIQIKYSGAKILRVNNDGSLEATTAQGTIMEEAPRSFDERGNVIRTSFAVHDNILTYNTDTYSGMLTIDPTLLWGTYYGGSNTDVGEDVSADSLGHVYMGGDTKSAANIATTGAYSTTYLADYDAYLVKFNNSGFPLWATYYGSDSLDICTSVTNDHMGKVFISGYTKGLTGIATPGAYHTANSGGMYDGFIACFDTAGYIQWATYMGDTGDDQMWGSCTDNSGNLYICGSTSSAAGIATPGALQTIYGGSYHDAFIAKFTGTGSLIWSTYYGGNSDEGYHADVATDDSGFVYMTSFTQSATGIATPGTYQPNNAGYNDAFLVKMNGLGERIWATYYGGSSTEFSYAVATDHTGGVYITGFTYSLDGITTPGAYQTIFNGANDGYLAKFDRNGALRWATYYGGHDVEYGYGLALDDYGHVFLMGNTESNSLISTAGSTQPAFGGYIDAFLAVFTQSGTRLWATYYGGTSMDDGRGITCDGNGNVYIAGMANSATAIATLGSYQPVYADGADAMLIKFCVEPYAGSIAGAASSVCPGDTIILSDFISGGSWTASNSNAMVAAGVITGIAAGADTIIYTVTNGCGSAAANYAIAVNPSPDAGTITGTDSICLGTSTTLTDTISGGMWSSSNTGIASINSGGVLTGAGIGSATISYIATNVCGTDTAVFPLIIKPLPIAGTITGNDSVCIDSNIVLIDTTSGGTWSAANGHATVTGGVVTGISAGTDNITYTVTNSCGTVTTSKTIRIINCNIDGVANPPMESMMDIYPNPAHDAIYITSSQPITAIAITNALGKVIYQRTLNDHKAAIDIRSISPGLYILRINNYLSYKIIKE